MKLIFEMNINSINTWFRPCYYCKYFNTSIRPTVVGYRECHHPRNEEYVYFMMCYTNEGKILPSSYQRNLRKIKYIRI